MSSTLKGIPRDIMAYVGSLSLSCTATSTLLGTLSVLAQTTFLTVFQNIDPNSPDDLLLFLGGLLGQGILMPAVILLAVGMTPMLGGFLNALLYPTHSCRHDPWVRTWAGVLMGVQTSPHALFALIMGQAMALYAPLGGQGDPKVVAIASLSLMGLGLLGLGFQVVCGGLGSRLGAVAKRRWVRRHSRSVALKGDVHPTGFYPAASPRGASQAGQSRA
jgi:hypothetical protein